MQRPELQRAYGEWEITARLRFGTSPRQSLSSSIRSSRPRLYAQLLTALPPIPLETLLERLLGLQTRVAHQFKELRDIEGDND